MLVRRAQAATAPRVVVVGAGVAGLTAAWRLQQAGIVAPVIEAGDRVGGRMFTLRDTFPNGQIVELGGELIDSDHTALMTLADELGLTLTDLLADAPDLETETLYFDNRHIPFMDVFEEFEPLVVALMSDLEALTDLNVTYHAPGNAAALDISLAEWLDRHEISGLARDVIEVAFVADFGLETDEQSAFNLFWLVGGEDDGGGLFGEGARRYHIAEGNDSVPRRLAEKLETPVALGMRLEAIRQMSGGAYRLTVDDNGRARDIDADRVVLALPFTLLRQIELDVELPAVKRRAIDELGYGTNNKLMLGFDTRVWQAAGSNGSSLTDLPYQRTWDASRGQPGESGILVNFTGGRAGLRAGDGTPEARAAEFLAQLEKVYPGASDAWTGQAVRFHWPSYPLTLGSYACYKPGQVAAFRGVEKEAVGGLHFAGEHTSLEYQGYMNGGVESGERAAAEILKRPGIL